MRRLVAFALLAGPLLYLRRRRQARLERVDVTFDDGSTVTLEPGSPAADELFAVARQAL